MVNEVSPRKEEAIAFLAWLTARKQQLYLAETMRNIPANRECAANMSKPLAEFCDGMENVIHPRLLSVEEYPLVTEAYDKGIQSILIGEASPDRGCEARPEDQRAGDEEIPMTIPFMQRINKAYFFVLPAVVMLGLFYVYPFPEGLPAQPF